MIEDDDAVMKMKIKSRSLHMRRDSRTHRLNLDWCLEEFNLDSSNISVKIRSH